MIFLLKNVGHCLRLLEIIMAYFYCKKNIYIVGTICNTEEKNFLIFSCLKTIRGIPLGFSTLSFISKLEYLYSSVFQFFKVLHIFLQERTIYLLNNIVGGLTEMGHIVLSLLVCCNYPSRSLYGYI